MTTRPGLWNFVAWDTRRDVYGITGFLIWQRSGWHINSLQLKRIWEHLWQYMVWSGYDYMIWWVWSIKSITFFECVVKPAARSRMPNCWSVCTKSTSQSIKTWTRPAMLGIIFQCFLQKKIIKKRPKLTRFGFLQGQHQPQSKQSTLNLHQSTSIYINLLYLWQEQTSIQKSFDELDGRAPRSPRSPAVHGATACLAVPVRCCQFQRQRKKRPSSEDLRTVVKLWLTLYNNIYFIVTLIKIY